MSTLKTKYVFVWALCIVVLLLASSSVRACTCDMPAPGMKLRQAVEQARQKSKAVFVGEVIEVISKPDVFYLQVRIRIEHAWKNVRANELMLQTGRGGGDCGYPFKVGERYLVYAYGSSDRTLGTNICQRTRKLIDAGDDLRLLGKGRSLKRN